MLAEGHFFQFCCVFGYQRCCVKAGGNLTDSFTLKGGLDKPPPEPTYNLGVGGGGGWLMI